MYWKVLIWSKNSKPIFTLGLLSSSVVCTCWIVHLEILPAFLEQTIRWTITEDAYLSSAHTSWSFIYTDNHPNIWTMMEWWPGLRTQMIACNDLLLDLVYIKCRVERHICDALKIVFFLLRSAKIYRCFLVLDLWSNNMVSNSDEICWCFNCFVSLRDSVQDKIVYFTWHIRVDEVEEFVPAITRLFGNAVIDIWILVDVLNVIQLRWEVRIILEICDSCFAISR